MTALLETNDLVIYRKSAKPTDKTDALIAKGLSLKFESGKLNAILGPNGCGKTTTLTYLYGVCDKTFKTSGSVLLDGEQRDPNTWFSKVSMVEQLSYFPEDEIVIHALRFSLGLKNSQYGTKDQLSNYSDLIDKKTIARHH